MKIKRMAKFLVLALLAILTACNKPGECSKFVYDVANNTYTNIVNRSVYVRGDGYYEATSRPTPLTSPCPNCAKWLNTGVNVPANTTITYEVSGMVSQCLGHGENVSHTVAGKVLNGDVYRVDLRSANNTPVSVPYPVRTGDKLTITVGDPVPYAVGTTGNRWAYAENTDFSGFNNWDPNLSETQNNDCATKLAGSTHQCWHTKGEALYMAIYNGSAYDYATAERFSYGSVTNITTSQAGYPSFFISPDSEVKPIGFSYSPGNPIALSDLNKYTGGFDIYVSHFCGPSIDGGDAPGTSWGHLEATILPPGSDPNVSAPSSTFDINGPTAFISAASTGMVWLRVTDCPGCYWDNTGSYQVKISYSTQEQGGISGDINDILVWVKTTILNFARDIYTGYLDPSAMFIPLVTAMLIVYFAGYAAMYLMGLAQGNVTDIAIRLTKIGLMAALISPSSWYFFYDRFFTLFINGSTALLGIIHGSTLTNPFTFLDSALGVLFSAHTGLVLVGLGSVKIVGWVVLLVVCIAIYRFLKAIIIGVVAYIFAYLILSMLIAMAPIFLLCSLPSSQGPLAPVRTLFQTWMSAMFRYALEPVLLFTGLIILVKVFTIFLIQVTSISVCWKCFSTLFPTAFAPLSVIFTLIEQLGQMCLGSYLLWGFDNAGFGFDIGLVVPLLGYAMIMYMVADAMIKWQEFSPRLVAYMTNTLNLNAELNLSGGHGLAQQFIDSTYGEAKDNILKPFGRDKESMARRASGNSKALYKQRDKDVKNKTDDANIKFTKDPTSNSNPTTSTPNVLSSTDVSSSPTKFAGKNDALNVRNLDDVSTSSSDPSLASGSSSPDSSEWKEGEKPATRSGPKISDHRKPTSPKMGGHRGEPPKE